MPVRQTRSSVRSVVRSIVAGAMLLGTAAPGMATPVPTTRLVDGPDGSYLLVSGQRDHIAQSVRINGHAVRVEGGRRWRARMALATVRAWSAPSARSIEVALGDAVPGQLRMMTADLPIGLLGHDTDLAFLVVRVN